MKTTKFTTKMTALFGAMALALAGCSQTGTRSNSVPDSTTASTATANTSTGTAGSSGTTAEGTGATQSTAAPARGQK